MQGNGSSSTEAMFQLFAENRELMQQIEVIVPVRPADGINLELHKALTVWYGEGVSNAPLNDHMGGFIELTRARIAYTFKTTKNPDHPTKYLLMIDNDMIVPMELPYLLARHDQPIVGVPAMSIHPMTGPRLCFTMKSTDGKYRYPSWSEHVIPSKGLVEVGHVGTGALMVRRDVIDSFAFEGEDVPFLVPQSVRLRGAREGLMQVGEDFWFCKQVKDKGFKCYVDLEAHCGHAKIRVMEWGKERRDPSLDPERWVLPATGPHVADNIW